MRADRLVATLLLLQRRGQVTAAEVAEELEVSERTARRDLDALGQAGLPIYSVQGRGGGWRLAGGGRTDLSGLSAAEAQALFLVAGPSSSATPAVRAALRKLVQALPEGFRAQAEAASAAVLVDRAGWDDGTGVAEGPAPRFLEPLQHAVVEGRQVRLAYVARDGSDSERVVHPLGLAHKGRSWYLVAGTDAGQRTFRVDRVRSVEPTGEPVVRPEGFDLRSTWTEVTDSVDELRLPVRVEAHATTDVVGLLRLMFGRRVRIGPPVGDDRVAVEVRGHHAHAVAGELAGLGDRVVVLGPADVRARLRELGAQLSRTYAATRA